MIDKRIISFLRKHHVLTLATCRGERAYCSNIFYVFDAERGRFVFASDETTRHAQEALENSFVAASVVLETRIVGNIKGVQIEGIMRRSDEDSDKMLYLKRFPYAMAMKLSLWILEPTYCKFTDNTLGFGTKLIWRADE